MRERVRSASDRPKADDSDLGESETLLYAQESTSVALIDENAGRQVADNLGIACHCTLDVLVAEYLEGRLDRAMLLRMWDQLRGSTLDGGATLPSDKGSLKRWKTPAPR